jgi:hypothetical protein
VGQAFSFSGSNGVDLPDSPQLEFTDQMTLGAWIEPLDVSGFHSILNKRGALSNFAYELVTEPNGMLRLSIANPATGGSPFDLLESPAGVLSANAWAHVATTFDAGVIRLYVNGSEVASKTSSYTTLYSAGAAHPMIGRLQNGSNGFLGLIDELAAFNRALSGAEVQTLYAAGASGMCGVGLVNSVDEPPLPARTFELAAPWPNPSARLTNIRFQLPAATVVRVEVFDVLGRRVTALIDGQVLAAGEHRAAWDGRDAAGRLLTAGVYQIRVTAGGAVGVRKVVVVEQ